MSDSSSLRITKRMFVCECEGVIAVATERTISTKLDSQGLWRQFPVKFVSGQNLLKIFSKWWPFKKHKEQNVVDGLLFLKTYLSHQTKPKDCNVFLMDIGTQYNYLNMFKYYWTNSHADSCKMIRILLINIKEPNKRVFY